MESTERKMTITEENTTTEGNSPGYDESGTP